MNSILSLLSVFPWIRRPAAPLRIPELFLTSNVKTAEELDSADSDIKFVVDSDSQTNQQGLAQLDPLPDSPRSCGDESWGFPRTVTPPEPRETVNKENINRNECQYPIHQGIFSELVDIANQALYHDTQSLERCSQSPALLLRTPVLGCMYYMQSVVETLAQKLHADLISFNYEDIADISVDFSLQESTSNHEAATLEELPIYYFDVDSTDDKGKENSVSESCPKKKAAAASKLQDSVLPQIVLERAAQQIAAKSVHELAYEKDMCSVIERLSNNQKMARERRKKGKPRKGNSDNAEIFDESECWNSRSDSDSDLDDINFERNQREENETFEKIKREFLKKHRSDANMEGLIDCVIQRIKVTLNDVVLDPDIKTSMKELLRLSKFQSKHVSQKLLQKMQIKGALLYGPPGTGKTHLARAIAKDMDMSFMAVTSATIETKYVGETEKLIKAMFSLCSELSPCILFIDEADALFSKRKSGDNNWTRSRINQFLHEMDGLSTGQDGPFVLIATN
ncbi:ATPase family AAA domain-containing protein [Fusarium denticulatum]|uniref:ATPase family AAA domain-containing protein n=1 Tax=Fusarium denticulatum TaxID=48507 RepID=A0A8H5T0X3_9HYPO|nr:ATPase family AAA domain-containing protein [Fusarium denticulatum]